MIIVMNSKATKENVNDVLDFLEKKNLKSDISDDNNKVVIRVKGKNSLYPKEIELFAGVSEVIKISSRFLHSNYLGNINDDNFKLNNCPITCSKKQCNCPKPKKYNQILIERDYKTAFKNMLLNYLYLPKHILKNRTIIKTKIKQLFNIT